MFARQTTLLTADFLGNSFRPFSAPPGAACHLSAFQPSQYVARILIGRKNGIEDVLDDPIFDHERYSLEQGHAARLEGRQGYRRCQREMLIRKDWKRQMQSARGLSLICAISGWKCRKDGELPETSAR